MPTRRCSTLLAGAAIACGVISTPAGAACDKALTIQSSDYAPYIYKDQQGKLAGLDVELVRVIFKEAGCAYSFAPLVAPQRMVEMVSLGKTDIMLAASESDERRQANRFGIAYRNESVSLVGLAGRVDAYRDVASFQTLRERRVRLLMPKAGWFGPAYERAKPALRAAGLGVEFTYMNLGIRMLAAGRGTLILSDTAAMFAAAKQEGVAIEALPFVVYKTPVHMMFSKASVGEHDIAQLNAATARLEKNGTLQAIRAAYGMR